MYSIHFGIVLFKLRPISFNRLHISIINNKTPFKKLHGTKPSISHLMVIGCLCFAKIVQENDKLKPRSKPFNLMEYSDVQKRYFLYDMTNNISLSTSMSYLKKLFFHSNKKTKMLQQFFFNLLIQLSMT